MVDQDGWEDVPTQLPNLSFGHEFDHVLQHIRLSRQQEQGRQVRSPSRVLRVLMIRHGETAYNVQGIIQGQMDTPLNSLGRKQALLTGNTLAQTPLNTIYSSPLQRTMDTASSIHQSHSNRSSIRIHPDDRLKERAFGSLEGQSFKGRKTDTIPGIEKTQDLQSRVAGFWNDLVEREATKMKKEGPSIRTVLLVGHGAALSALLEVLSPHTLFEDDVKASRLWNCSVTEMAVMLPTLDATEDGASKEWRVQPFHLLSQSKASLPATERNIIICRWADIRHLELPLGTHETPSHGGNQEQSAAAVHKNTNADEIILEEDDR